MLSGVVVAHRLGGLAVKQGAGAGEQELEVVVQLGHRAHGGSGELRTGLVWSMAIAGGTPSTLSTAGLSMRIEKLARVGAEGLHVAPLALGVQGVEHQGGLARTAGAGDHRQLPVRMSTSRFFEVVLARAVDADKTVGGIGEDDMAGGKNQGALLSEAAPGLALPTVNVGATSSRRLHAEAQPQRVHDLEDGFKARAGIRTQGFIKRFAAHARLGSNLRHTRARAITPRAWASSPGSPSSSTRVR